MQQRPPNPLARLIRVLDRSTLDRGLESLAIIVERALQRHPIRKAQHTEEEPADAKSVA